MINTTRLVVDQDDETDMVVFENRNGDYFMDSAYESTVDPQWYCLADDKTISMRRDSIAIDSNGFNVIGTSFLGLVSFGVSTQDGTGIGYMSFADDTISDDRIKGGGLLCDNGSNYDGLYYCGAITADTASWVSEGMSHVYFVAFDSVHGVITSEKLSIELTSPNGGENWTFGTTQNITWTSEYVSKVRIEYSTDGGQVWHEIAADVDADAGTYSWEIPDSQSSECLVRISDMTYVLISDESESEFIIIPPYINVLLPAENDIWTAESTKEITWEFSGVSNVKIDLSVDDGSSWQEIAAGISAASGSYGWEIPNIKSSQCFIRISDTANPDILNLSGRFEIMQPELKIAHTPVTEAIENEEITFTAVITSSSDIDKVAIYYDLTGRRQFSDNLLQMQSADGENFSVTLGFGVFTALGMEYYITASDVNNKINRVPADVGFYSIEAHVSVVNSTNEITGGSAQNAYRMISVPLYLAETSIVDQLEGKLPPGDSGTDWRLFRFSPGSKTPQEYPDIEGLSPGNAFWLITKNDFRLEVNNGTTVTTSEMFNINLNPGWNDIANPWMFDISWDDIKNPSGAYLSVLHTYEGSWSDPGSINVLEPWKGYAVRNNENISVVIRLVPNPAKASSKIAAEDENILWKLIIKASAGEASDTANHLGVREDASVEWDRYDHVEPPPIGEYISVSFPHNDWEQYPYDYTVDFRPPESTISWDFDVKTNISGEMVTVNIEGIDDLPEKHYVKIFDRDSKHTVDINNNAYSFISGKKLTERHFKLIVSDSDNPELEGYESRPEKFVTAMSYPNPFNPQTTIHYELSMTGKVTISVYNALGQHVKVYDFGQKDQGVHEFVFNASDLTSGIYFYKVDAGYASVVGKMLYMK